jgi:amino acid transporter
VSFDFFTLWRFLLGTVVTVYASIVIVQTAIGYYLWLSAPDRYTSILRRYVVLHGLRLRIRQFGHDLLVCLLLLAALAITTLLHFTGV